MEAQKTPDDQSNTEQNNKPRGITIPDTRYITDIVIQTTGD